MIQTPNTKSLLSSIFKRGSRVSRDRKKRGRGDVGRICLVNYGLLRKCKEGGQGAKDQKALLRCLAGVST
jgi:hypothetical protein